MVGQVWNSWRVFFIVFAILISLSIFFILNTTNSQSISRSDPPPLIQTTTDSSLFGSTIGYDEQYQKQQISSTTTHKHIKKLSSIWPIINTLKNSANPSQLNDNQLWSVASVLAAVEMAESNPNFLSFGVGPESSLFCQVNANGANYFFEDKIGRLKEYKSKVFDRLPIESGDVNIVPVVYHETKKAYKAFFDNPRLIDIPEELKSVCYDVILIDGPKGFLETDPGRMEAGYFTKESIAQCFELGIKDTAYVFMHDSSREIEQRIIKDYFEGEISGEFLFKIDGNFGDLVAYKFTSNNMVS